MSLDEFNDLSLKDKADILWRIGTYLEGIEYYGCPANLYSIGGHFVETRLNKNSGEIEEIRFVTGKALDKYLNRIRLSL